jgi:hypothetical protein
MRKTLILVLGGLVSLILVAPPASAAKPIVQNHYDDVISMNFPNEDFPDELFCDLPQFDIDNPVHLEGFTSGLFKIQFRGSSEYPFFQDVGNFDVTYTNPYTGKTFRVVGRYLDKDLHVVDNGDGTLTITSISTVSQRVYGPDGELLFEDRGLIRDSFLVDSMGTIDPDDDEVIDELGDPIFSGNLQTADRDFCVDFVHFTS